MTHAGLPLSWALLVISAMAACVVWAIVSPAPVAIRMGGLSLNKIPLVGGVFGLLVRKVWLLLPLKVIFVAIFVLIIIAGLWGSPIPERNIATALTWNIWWTGIVIAIVFSGSAWCAVCPWDTLANWVVNHRLWRRSDSNSRLHLPVPKMLRRLWPAVFLFVGFTWLELGVGIVASPYATAVLALVMVVLATLGLSLFEGKAFCRYACPVGRTVGVYSQLAPVALRPVDSHICSSCETLECYHGDDVIAPCPTKLVMGRISESTYCLSCGNCTQSCPSSNIGWQLRTPSTEAVQEARPHMDEAVFMLVLLALTSFHGLTMLPIWQQIISVTARSISGNEALLLSFTLGLLIALAVPIVVYALAVWVFTIGQKGLTTLAQWAQCFSGFAFISLPLAFSYHLSHNFSHLLREPNDWNYLLTNPLGVAALPLSMAEKHQRHMDLLFSEQWLFALQSSLLIIGFWIAVMVVRHRGFRLFGARGWSLAPLLVFALVVAGANLWLSMQSMTMRM